jgi:hypothetical protein
MPVPRLPLEIVLTATKDGSTPRQPLTCGSDRSCVTRASPTNTLPDTPVGDTQSHKGGSSCSALPLPPLPIGAIVTQVSREDPQNIEPWSPQSLTGFSTPRNDLSLAKLTLASPRSGSLQTPTGSPMMSPHSPKSPSMMSPMRLVGNRSPCSFKLSGGSSTRFGGRDGHKVTENCTSGGTTPFTSPRGQLKSGGGGITGANTNTNNPNASSMGMRPRKPNVSRALPFTQPTPAAELSARQTVERFHIPHLNGRELSFSDLLDPCAKDRVHSRMNTTMPLSFVNAVGGGGDGVVGDGVVGVFGSAITSVSPTKQPAPIVLTAPGTAPSTGGRGGIPTSPTVATYQGACGACGSGDGDGHATPRKRPRKNVAPQRADFGNEDTCGGGGSSNTNDANGDSSHGETSIGPMNNTRSSSKNHTNNNTTTANNNNAANIISAGFGSMNWEREDAGQTSALKKNQQATSSKRNTNDAINNGYGMMNSGSDVSGGVSAPAPAPSPAPSLAVGSQQVKGLHKRDYQ